MSSSFRISNQQLINQSMGNLQDSFKKLADLQDQASSLKRLRRPSDAPADVASAMTIHSDLGRNTQIARNLDDAEGWLGTADNALTSVVTQLQRVHDLVVQARNASLSSTSREAIATEIDSIKQSLIGLANSQYAGRPIFGGTVSGGAAYQSDGTYVGISTAVERTIAPGQRIQVNVNGDDVFGTPGDDIFANLTEISAAVRSDPTQLDALSATLDSKTQQVQSQLATVGTRFQRVEAMKSQNSSDALTMKQNMSNLEDADLAQVMINLQTQQVAYQAALQATARAIQPSLADFLR
jgi:flagellar hook-associated protein 3 FlgL